MVIVTHFFGDDEVFLNLHASGRIGSRTTSSKRRLHPGPASCCGKLMPKERSAR